MSPLIFKRPGVIVICLAWLFSILLSACDSGSEVPTPRSAPSNEPGGAPQPIAISSPAFVGGQPIPRQYSCDGQGISPPLQWGDPPPRTQTLALIVDDPDAPGGTFVHWLVYNMPPTIHSLPEGVPIGDIIAGGGTQGKNGSGKVGYSGPCPPGGTHHYHFKLYALDTTLALAPGADKAHLEQAMDTHVLAQGELIGIYSK